MRARNKKTHTTGTEYFGNSVFNTIPINPKERSVNNDPLFLFGLASLACNCFAIIMMHV